MIWRNTNALRTTASVFGAYAGLLGMEHGYFEARHGNVATPGTRILAVAPPGLPFPFGHEPAMTLVHNFLVTGILAMVFGLFIVIWAVCFVHRRYGAAALFLLSIILLLVGGGFGPMSLLITAFIAAAWIGNPLGWWRAHLPANFRRMLAVLWSWFFLAALFWVPIEFALGYILGLKNDPNRSLTNLNLILSYPLLLFFLLTLVTSFAREAGRQVALNPTT